MVDDYLVFERNEIDTFSELDDEALEEWDSLKDLLSETTVRENSGPNSGAFGVPALGDGDGIARWVLVLGNVRRLSLVSRLRQELPRHPWCIAARAIEVGPETIRLGVTTTLRVSDEQLRASIQPLLDEADGTTIEIEPILPRSNAERWLTIDDVSHQLGVKTRTVKRWIEIGLIVARQVETASGPEWRVRLRQPAAHLTLGV